MALAACRLAARPIRRTSCSKAAELAVFSRHRWVSVDLGVSAAASAADATCVASLAVANGAHWATPLGAFAKAAAAAACSAWVMREDLVVAVGPTATCRVCPQYGAVLPAAGVRGAVARTA
ncbi:unnamed protein product [Prorocentrum cordatum]|uniref:Uncharacterized protein n=1 Tax=Prorocentrum cordatum TaxID=2364126 RepID=A0ABN9UG97_9DINO|nr:unnamed protein product [Polarella glacialis]